MFCQLTCLHFDTHIELCVLHTVNKGDSVRPLPKTHPGQGWALELLLWRGTQQTACEGGASCSGPQLLNLKDKSENSLMHKYVDVHQSLHMVP